MSTSVPRGRGTVVWRQRPYVGCVRMARVEGARAGKVRSFDSTASTEEEEAEENVEEGDKEEEEEQAAAAAAAEGEEEEVGNGPWLVEGTGLRQSLCVGTRIEA
ncbi:unnamed protein product [Sphagnum troendelagicum]|uniref:Uncharacterized protein n=1 Tax=Sphagnum troendelagicum TaxID=128251 RepID=A0ABP0TCN9_9BRYO